MRSAIAIQDVLARPQAQRALKIHLSSGTGEGPSELAAFDAGLMAAAPAARPHDAIRNPRERLIQTLGFEALGVLMVGPLFAHFADASAGESLSLLIALSIAVMCWTAVYSTAFDRIEFRCAGRVASDRPHGLRLAHTIGQEATAVFVTWPLIVALTPLGWTQALEADVALTVTYAAYGYLFHLGFDRLRPVCVGANGARNARAVLRQVPVTQVEPARLQGPWDDPRPISSTLDWRVAAQDGVYRAWADLPPFPSSRCRPGPSRCAGRSGAPSTS